MAIGRGQISAQIDGKLRGARGEKKKKLQVIKKPNSKKPKVFKVQSKSGTIQEAIQPSKGEVTMPLNKRGKKIMKSMKEQYGSKKGENVFYASLNKGKIKGVEKKLLGGLLVKGMRELVKSKPYQAARKTTMQKTAEAYKKSIADRNKPKAIKEAEKDTKFMRGLQKLDTSRVKGEKLMDMSQFLIKEARSSGRRDMTKVGRGLRRASYEIGRAHV